MSTDKERFSPSARMQGINPFRVMTVLQRARELEAGGRSIIHLEVGEPDFSTAAPVVEAGIAALNAGHTRYTPAAGMTALRERISQHYLQKFHVEVDPGRIFITPGASGALALLAQLLLDPGDEVLMTDPGYPCNRNYVRLAGGQATLVPIGEHSAWQLSTELLDRYAGDRCRGLWLASPANPTGAVLTLAEMQCFSDWARRRNCHFMVDEIYHGLDYCSGLPSALQADQDAIVVNSFSKYFGMTGWRLGWLIVPSALSAGADILAQNLFISAPTMAQYAALRCFDEDVQSLFEARRAEFGRRRDFLHNALQNLGFEVGPLPQGAFYIYAGIDGLCGETPADSERFCHELLEQQGVAVTPGTDFGEHLARSYVRFAFTTDMASLEIAVERLGSFLRDR